MKIVFTEIANQEYRDIILWYKKLSFTLATSFVADFEGTVERLPENPEIGTKSKEGFRRVMLQRFPYCIYYKPVRDEIIIYSIYHLHRNSPYWLT